MENTTQAPQGTVTEGELNNPQVSTTDEGKEPTQNYQELYEKEKKMRSDSTREFQALSGKLKSMEQKFQSLTSEEVTDAEVVQEYPEWDFFSENEKRLAKNLLLTKKQNLKTQEYVVSIAEREVEQVKINNLYQEYPEVAKRKEEFKSYMEMESHKGVPVESLAKSFLFDLGDLPTTKKTSTRTIIGLEDGSGGAQNNNPKPQRDATSQKYLDSLKNSPMFKNLIS